MSGATLDNLSTESRSFPPPEGFAERANATAEWYERAEADYRDVTIVDAIPGITAPGIMTTLVILVAAKGFNGPLGAENMVSTIAGLAKVFGAAVVLATLALYAIFW